MNQPSGEQGDFIAEAQLAIDDVADGIVAEKCLSNRLNNPQDISIAYINIKTNAKKEFCIELSQNGYRIVGQQFDENSQPSTTYYESLQALLSNESKSYVDGFAHSLQEKLFQAQNQLENNSDDE